MIQKLLQMDYKQKLGKLSVLKEELVKKLEADNSSSSDSDDSEELR